MTAFPPSARRSAAHLDAGQLGVGDVDLQAEDERAVGLAEGIGAQGAGGAAVERLVEDEVEGAHVGDLVAVDGAADESAEVGTNSLGGQLAHECRVQGVGGGEDGDVGEVALVTAARLGDVAQRNAPRAHTATASSTDTSTPGSTSSR